MTQYRVTVTAIALTLTAVTAAAQESNFGAGTPESRYFRTESSVGTGRGGAQVEGYVYNVYEAHALRVRLEVEALDASGRLLERRTAYVPLDVPRTAAGTSVSALRRARRRPASPCSPSSGPRAAEAAERACSRRQRAGVKTRPAPGPVRRPPSTAS